MTTPNADNATGDLVAAGTADSKLAPPSASPNERPILTKTPREFEDGSAVAATGRAAAPIAGCAVKIARGIAHHACIRDGTVSTVVVEGMQNRLCLRDAREGCDQYSEGERRQFKGEQSKRAMHEVLF